MQGILTDLDGTLLNIDMNEFIPKYLKNMNAFGVKTGLVPKENNLIPMVLKGTEAMLKSTDESKTNEQVFMECFFQDPYFADRREQALQFFDQFYEEIFPGLHSYCKPFSFAPRLADAMFETGLEVALATSPLFPMAAIEARMKWAGVADHPWKWKTSYEIMHTCKPHAAYYQETAAMMGLDPKACMMIGNDRQDDLPASRVGMTTYLLEEMVLDNGQASEKPTYHGKAEDLIAFLEHITASKA